MPGGFDDRCTFLASVGIVGYNRESCDSVFREGLKFDVSYGASDFNSVQLFHNSLSLFKSGKVRGPFALAKESRITEKDDRKRQKQFLS